MTTPRIRIRWVYAKQGRKKFHRPNCKWAAPYIGTKEGWVRFPSAWAAMNKGLKPCGTCSPEARPNLLKPRT